MLLTPDGAPLMPNMAQHLAGRCVGAVIPSEEIDDPQEASRYVHRESVRPTRAKSAAR